MRLFPELEVEDPVMDEARFTRELVPTMLVMEAGESHPDPAFIVGYTYFQLLGETAYVRHIITAPEARRTGVARALLDAILELARQRRCTTWCLNVKPDNAAAITLYESMGLARGFLSTALVLPWSFIDGRDDVSMHDARISARVLEPADDAKAEPPMKLMNGQLASARALGGRVIMGLVEGDEVVGATVFDPKFPGAYPFRVARPELAFVLLRAIRSSARPEDATVNVVIEGQPDVAALLLAAGATLKLDIQHMRAPLPAAPT